jgi:YVTN family beta-propeller protein
MSNPNILRRRLLAFVVCGYMTMTGSMYSHTVPPSSLFALARPLLTGRPAGQSKTKTSSAADTPLPGMPPVLDPQDLYTADRPNQLSATVKNFPSRIYVPNSESNSVDVIDPTTFKIIEHFDVGQQPQHIVPSYDLKTLWVLDDKGNGLTRIDPATGKKGETVPVADPYNLYFTPNGEEAIVVAESLHRLDFRDARTMNLKYSLTVPCDGVNHMDFSADGRYLVASCEFDGKLIKVDVTSRAVLATLKFGRRSMPQDIRLSPDGSTFYVADMGWSGVHVIDAARFTQSNFLRTGRGAHGLYASRDSKLLYISNRGEGSISVLDFEKKKVVKKWRIPHGGSPDMGGISADGNVLWLSGRYDAEVYAIDTSTGKLITRIAVGKGPHGLCVYPQPGRYSLGHTGVFR